MRTKTLFIIINIQKFLNRLQLTLEFSLVVEQVMYKKNTFHRIQNKFIDLKIRAEKELKILTSLKSNKQTAAYAGWVGYDNLGDEVLYQSYIKLFRSFCFIPYKSNSIVERYYKFIKKQVYDIGVLGERTLINQDFRWLKEVKENCREKRFLCFALVLELPKKISGGNNMMNIGKILYRNG